MSDRIDLMDLSLEGMQEFLAGMGQQKFRAKQIYQWVNKGIKSFEEMTNLSKALRQDLEAKSFIGRLRIVQKLQSEIDGTRKYLFELKDKNVIESVLMEYKHGFTVCISTQVGCRMGCRFCASTGIGFMRSLTPGEMLDQVISIQNDTGERVGNVVLMGIGEPLDNYGNVLKFLNNINSPDGLNISYRKLTVSTCGLVPEILRFTREGLPVNLSISLHAPNDEIRERNMPINRKYSIDKIIEACKIYTEETKRRVTFEYAMISGANDSRENALELAGRIKGMLCHVNLIPVNSIENGDFKRSRREKTEAFKEILERYGIETTIRRELGEDIEAACGQLRRGTLPVDIKFQE